MSRTNGRTREPPEHERRCAANRHRRHRTDVAAGEEHDEEHHRQRPERAEQVRAHGGVVAEQLEHFALGERLPVVPGPGRLVVTVFAHRRLLIPRTRSRRSSTSWTGSPSFTRITACVPRLESFRAAWGAERFVVLARQVVQHDLADPLVPHGRVQVVRVAPAALPIVVRIGFGFRCRVRRGNVGGPGDDHHDVVLSGTGHAARRFRTSGSNSAPSSARSAMIT